MDRADLPTEPEAGPSGRLRRPRWRFLRPWQRLEASGRREVILALLLLFCYGFFRQVPAWNEYSRYDLTRALVEDGTTRIDRYAMNTGDKAVFDGHYYSDKAPGTSFLGVPVYRLFTLSAVAVGAPEPEPGSAVQALAFGVSGLSTALLVLLLVRFLRPIVGETWALILGLAYGLGSIAFPFATMLFGHAASAFFLFAAFYVLWSAEQAGRPIWLPSLAGFMAGWAVLVELSALLGVLILLAYALVHAPVAGRLAPSLRWSTLGQVILGGSIPAALLLIYNAISFGSPFSLGYTNLAAGGFAEGMARGILGVEWPDPDVLGDLLVGSRGLLRMAPWFVLAPIGLAALARPGRRREVLVSGAIVVAFLIFNAGYYLPFGGWTPGPRFLMPALPFAAILVALAPRRVRPLAALLFVAALVLMLVATATMPNAPEGYADPLLDLWIPRLVNGDLAETVAWTRWGLHGIAPLVILAIGLGAALIGTMATLRASASAGRVAAGSTGALVVLVVAMGLPLAPVRGADLALGGAHGNRAAVAVVDLGSVPVVRDGHTVAIVWALLENRGAAIDGTRVAFTVYDAGGQPSWSAWHGDLSWRFGDRRRLAVEWDTRDVHPGVYRFDAVVYHGDQSTTLARRSGVVRVDR